MAHPPLDAILLCMHRDPETNHVLAAKIHRAKRKLRGTVQKIHSTII